MKKKVSFLIPVLNEEKHIGNMLKHLEAQDYGKENLEILIANGKSTDSTENIIKKWMKKNKNITLLKNPTGNTAIGRNICLKKAKGKYIFNFSGHSYAAKNYVSTLVKVLEKKPEQVMAVGASSNPPDEEAPFISRCINVVFGTFLGGVNGMDQNINHGKEKEVQSVAFTAYRKEAFKKVGDFDEDLWCGQDGEFNIRLRKAGYKILFTPETYTKLQKRDTVKKFYRQMYRYGIAGALRTKKHSDTFKPILLLPSIGVLGFFALLILSLAKTTIIGISIWQVFGLAVIIYLLAGVTNSIFAAQNLKIAFASPLFYAIIHFGYGLGFIRGLFSKRF